MIKKQRRRKPCYTTQSSPSLLSYFPLKISYASLLPLRLCVKKAKKKKTMLYNTIFSSFAFLISLKNILRLFAFSAPLREKSKEEENHAIQHNLLLLCFLNFS
jgi:hypothetical protein